MLDNVTYHTTAVPEPTSLIGLLGLGAFGVTSKFKRKQKQQVHC
ncbi:PEP-CTERM sorting domain-containing protein [Nostoc sp. UHCC 0252]|nr:PEP-CTERM sorting domain-containing protein [Nostoc sp. UHCC 0252]MEA5605456.1 PEP-CTERM sorting domain-containing protein [Nostoc sp. UHCC 0252]